MSTITSPDQFSDHKKYEALVKKTLSQVKVDKPEPFVYFEVYLFDQKKKAPCVLVDYSSQCLDALKKARKVPTASGVVSLTSDGKLKFVAKTGTLKPGELKKSLATMQGIPEVWVDPNEADGAAPAKAFQVATPTPGKDVRAVTRPTVGAPGQGRPTNAAPSRPEGRTPPPTRVAIPLPDSPTEREQLVKDFATGLLKANLPNQDPNKNDVIKQALVLSKAGKHEEAMRLLNELARNVVYVGVEEWAVQRPLRKYEVELLSEKFHALTNLIKHKRKNPTDFAAEESEIGKHAGQIYDFSDGIQAGLLAADPAAVKKAFDIWAPLVAKQQQLAGNLKKLWMADQEARFLREAGKSKSSSNVRMANSYGKDAILEMAQMAEVQAISFQNDHKNKNNPLAQGKWHEKLEIAEMAAIYGYSTADYTAVGQLLRGKEPETEAEKKAFAGSQQKFAEYIEAAKKGLAKLPAYQGSGVRCTKSLWQETIDEITKTGGHVEKSFMSVGKQKVSGFGDIEWHFEKITTGKDITMFSLHQTEGEILFPPGARFKFYRAETTAPDGQQVKFGDFRQFSNYVTPATKVGKFYFQQIT